MLYSVSNVIMILLICNPQTSILCNDKEDLIFRLNAILYSSGWSRIDHIEGKHQCSTNSFSGSALFIPIEEPDLFHVTDENVYDKYLMTTRLIECVYAKALLDYLYFVISILRESSRQAKSVSQRLRCRRYYSKFHREKRRRGRASPLSYDIFWELLDLAFGEIEKSRTMFDCMIDALTFLIESLNKLRTSQSDINIVLSIMNSVVIIRDVQRFVIHYNDENRGKYNVEISMIPFNLERHFNFYVIKNLSSFINQHCVLTENTSENQSLNVHRAFNIEDAQIEIVRLENKVIKNYYRELGFLREEEGILP